MLPNTLERNPRRDNLDLNYGSPFVDRLINFLDRSPTPWHAVANISEYLEHRGFIRLDERTAWRLEAGASYFTVRSDGALVAWRQPVDVVGWTIFGAHTDSPNLRVRPDPIVKKHGYFQLGLEVYGGVLLSTWFDRDLSLAGRVAIANEGAVLSELVDFERPVGVIPNLAIHLDRDANKGRKINPQDELPLILSRAEKDADDQEARKRIIMKNYMDTKSCDLVLAYLPKEINARRPSYGTTFEIAWGYSMQKPVVVVSDDVRVHDHPLMDLSGALFWDLEEAIDYVNILLEPYDALSTEFVVPVLN